MPSTRTVDSSHPETPETPASPGDLPAHHADLQALPAKGRPGRRPDPDHIRISD